MNLEELKAFLESAEGKSDKITAYLQGLSSLTVARVQSFVDTPEGKSWLDSVKDKHLQKGLETWKTNNLGHGVRIERVGHTKDPAYWAKIAVEEYAEYVSHKLMSVVDMIHVEQLLDDISGIIGDEAPWSG